MSAETENVRLSGWTGSDRRRGKPTRLDPQQTSASLSNGSRLCFRIRSSPNENVADTLQDDFASLITQSDLVAHDASIGFRLRLPLLQNNQFEIEFVSRAHRVRQSQLIPTHSSEDTAERLSWFAVEPDPWAMMGNCHRTIRQALASLRRSAVARSSMPWCSASVLGTRDLLMRLQIRAEDRRRFFVKCRHGKEMVMPSLDP
jgi:hypothetical protein